MANRYGQELKRSSLRGFREMGMLATLRQVRLLLWKNLLVQWRQPVWTIAEIVFPCIVTIILLVLSKKVRAHG